MTAAAKVNREVDGVNQSLVERALSYKPKAVDDVPPDERGFANDEVRDFVKRFDLWWDDVVIRMIANRMTKKRARDIVETILINNFNMENHESVNHKGIPMRAFYLGDVDGQPETWAFIADRVFVFPCEAENYKKAVCIYAGMIANNEDFEKISEKNPSPNEDKNFIEAHNADLDAAKRVFAGVCLTLAKVLNRPVSDLINSAKPYGLDVDDKVIAGMVSRAITKGLN